MSILDSYFPKQKAEAIKSGLSIGIYGDFGSGKTHFSATLPEPILFVDMDDGTDALKNSSISNVEIKSKFSDKDIRLISISIGNDEVLDEDLTDEEFDQATIDKLEYEPTFLQLLRKFESVLIKLEQVARSGELKGGSIVVDSATWVWKGCTDYMKYTVLKKKITDKETVDIMTQWPIASGRYAVLLKRLIYLRKYGINIVVTGTFKDKYVQVMKSSGKKGAENTGESIADWHKSTNGMLNNVIRIDVEKNDKKEVTKRTASFEKIRGSDNMLEQFGTIEDITWNKFVKRFIEVSNNPVKSKSTTRRVRTEKSEVTNEKSTEKSDNKSSDKGKKRRR